MLVLIKADIISAAAILISCAYYAFIYRGDRKMVFDFELVGKIGSMALIRKEDMDIDYNIFSRLGEIGRAHV